LAFSGMEPPSLGRTTVCRRGSGAAAAGALGALRPPPDQREAIR
jgi:hypothetical protein